MARAEDKNVDSGGLLAYIQKASMPNRSSWLATQWASYRKFPRLDLTFRLIRAGRDADAKRELNRLLADDPTDLSATSIYMIVLYNERDYKGVLRRCEEILKAYPSFVPALIYRGLAWQSLGNTEKAMHDFLLLAGSRSLNKSDYIFTFDTLADLALAQKQYEEALRALGVLASWKRDTRFYYRQGLALQGVGRSKEAVAAFEHALDAASDTPERIRSLQILGDLSLQQAQWKRAFDWYGKALELEPNDPVLLRQCARAAFESRNYTVSVQLMRRLLAVGPAAADHMYLGNVLVAQKNTRAAEVEFRAVLTSTRDENQLARAYRALIELAIERKDSAEALRLAQALGKISKAEEDRQRLAILLEKQMDYPNLAAELRKTAADGSLPASLRYEAFYKLGNVYALLLQDENAAAAFQNAIQVQMTIPAFDALSRVQERSGHIEEAVAAAREALRMEPSAARQLSLGNLLEKAGHQEQALQAFDAATTDGAGSEVSSQAWARAGYIYAAQRRPDQARAAFGKALGLHSADPELNAAMARVCIELKDFAGALPWLERAQASQSSPELMKLTALAQAQTGNIDKAVAIYERLLSSYPHPSADAEETGIALGYLETGREKYALAATHFRKAFEDSMKAHPELLAEAAQNFYKAKDWKGAVETWSLYRTQPGIPNEAKREATESLGFSYVSAGDSRSAAEIFRQAIENGDKRPGMHRNLAFAFYELREWRLSLNEFLKSLEGERDASALAGAARCYQQLHKPGLAIDYLQKALVLTPAGAGRQPLLQDLAYLNEAAQDYSSAARALQDLLRDEEDFSIRLRAVRNLRLAGNTQAAEQSLAVTRPESLAATDHVRWLDERAAIMDAKGDHARAIASLAQANAISPAAWRDYQLGLDDLAMKNLAEALKHFQMALSKEPENTLYIQALAYGFESAGNQREAARMFAQLAAKEPDNPRWPKQLGYVDMRLFRNREAAGSFRAALDRTPTSGAGATEAEQENYRIRSEISRLTDTYQLTYYHGYNTGNFSRTAAIDLLGSDLFPAPSGVEAAWQPPFIGFRNGRSLQVFGRVLWNDPDNSFTFNTKLYQGSIGIRYKPLISQNLWFSAEEIFHVPQYSTGKWLFRGLYSWNPGFELKLGKKRWKYTLASLDSSFIPGRNAVLAQYGETRRGITFNIGNSLLLTPHIVGDARWQSGTEIGGTYFEAGAGVSLRYLFRQNQYEAQRSSFEIVLQCKRGVAGMNNFSYNICSTVGIVRF